MCQGIFDNHSLCWNGSLGWPDKAHGTRCGRTEHGSHDFGALARNEQAKRVELAAAEQRLGADAYLPARRRILVLEKHIQRRGPFGAIGGSNFQLAHVGGIVRLEQSGLQ